MTDSAKQMMLRFAPMIYGPTVLFALGQGAIIPLIPIIANRMGADLALSGLIASALVLGQLCGNLPAGWLVARFGERIMMASAGTFALVGVLGLVFSPNLTLLAASVFIIGLCGSAFGLARHAFMTTRVPFAIRARALALLGGAHRFGMFIGPFATALLLQLTGTEAAAAWCFAICLVATVLLVLLGPDPERSLEAEEAAARRADDPGAATSSPGASSALEAPDTGDPLTGPIDLTPGPSGRPASAGSEGVFRTMARYRGVLSRLGLAAASLSAVRAAKQVVLPLWGLSLGLEAHTISIVIGIAGAIDFALFYASGQVMDRFGRLWAALPSMVLMGAGFLLLAFTHDLPDAAMWFAMSAAVIGVANGLSSGILMVLGADVAPQHDPAPFLGSWRTLSDAGGALSPVLFSVLAAVSTLGIATGAIGTIALLGAIGFWRWVPMFVSRPRPEA